MTSPEWTELLPWARGGWRRRCGPCCPQHLGLVQGGQELFLLQFLLELSIDRHGLFVLPTLCRDNNTGQSAYADRTAIVLLPPAAHGVRHDPLHLVARVHAAVGIPALAGVHQARDAPHGIATILEDSPVCQNWKSHPGQGQACSSCGVGPACCSMARRDQSPGEAFNIE